MISKFKYSGDNPEFDSTRDQMTVFEYYSPVEFILIATTELGRKVVARSKGAKIDLLYYSNFSNPNHLAYINEKSTKTNLSDLFYPSLESLSPFSVDSHPVPPSRNQTYDDRNSSFTFVWRGVGGNDLYKEIVRFLDDMAPLLVYSLSEKSELDTEWLLSPIVAKCAESIAKMKRIRLAKAARLKIMIGVVLGYTLIAAAAFLYVYVAR